MIVIWVTFIWAALGTKVYSEGITGTAEFFTNISLLIQAIYYTFDLVTYFCDPDTRVLEQVLLFTFFFPIFANAFDVFFMVLFVFLDNASIFTSNLESAGGMYNDGLVFLLERGYHVFPLLVAFVYLVLRMQDIVDILVSKYGQVHIEPRSEHDDPSRTLRDRMSFHIRYQHGITYIKMQYLLSLVPFSLYVVVADVKTVYDIDFFGDAIGVVAIIGLNLISVVLILYTIMFYHIPTVEVPHNIVPLGMDIDSEKTSITVLSSVIARRPDRKNPKRGSRAVV